MSSSENNHRRFNQDEYTNTFYYCEGDDEPHPFIAFTTCFCPLCEKTADANLLASEVVEVANQLEDLHDIHGDLVLKVRNVAPELLI